MEYSAMKANHAPTTGDVVLCHKTVVKGANMLNARMLNLFASILAAEEKAGNPGLEVLYIKKRGPGNCYGHYYAALKSAALFIEDIADLTIKNMSEEGLDLTIHAGLWANLIHIFAHELGHRVNHYLMEIGNIDPMNTEEDDEAAKQFARQTLCEICRDLNAEPPSLEEIPVAGPYVIAYMKAHATEKPWINEHTGRMAQGVGIVAKESNHLFTSLKEFFGAVDVDENRPKIEAVPTQTAPTMDLGATPFNPAPATTEDEVINYEPPEMPVATAEMEADMKAASLAYDISDDPLDYMDDDPEGMSEMGQTLIPQPYQRGYIPTVAECFNQAAAQQAATPPPATPPATQANMDAKTIVKEVGRRLVNNIFTNCVATAGGFSNPMGILTPVQLTQQELASGLFESYTTLNQNHQPLSLKPADTGVITGRTFSNGTLPVYTLTIAGCDFRFLPQNPQKKNAKGEYTWCAKEAQQGHQICFVILARAKDANGQWADVNSWVGMYRDGKYYVPKEGGFGLDGWEYNYG